MSADTQWNVFLPLQLWQEPPGYLIGCVRPDNHLIYVSGITDTKQNFGMWKTLGFWSNTRDNSSLPAKPKMESCWVIVQSDGITTGCSLFVRSMSGSLEPKPVVCIMFDPSQVMKSFILTKPRKNNCVAKDVPHADCETKRLNLADTVAGRLRSRSVLVSKELDHDSPKTKQQDCVTLLCDILQQCTAHGDSWPDNVKFFYSSPKKQSPSFLRAPLVVMSVIMFLEKIFTAVLQGFKICCSPFPKILHTPSIIQYLQDKFVRFNACLDMKKSEKFNRFLLYNCYSQQLLDSALGIAVIALVTIYGIHHIAAVFILDWADGVAHQLSNLVHWLMGAPAGLKLNAQLTKFLGHFFIYHIYLWTGYLSLLRTLMSSLLWYSSLVGVLGVSAQLCLLRDLLSMLTLHIYCFYVYAAKIFSLQVYMIGSLWRLFRGKKWNVLRSRVDSAEYGTDQLFVGTLLFTVLLFLLPTTALYYAVFTFLRLATLAVQGCLAYILDFIMVFPAFTVGLKVLRPTLLAGNVKFSVQHAPRDTNFMALHMQTCQIPLSNLLSLTTQFMRPATKQSYTWLEFVSHLATGKLIYPWVEPHTGVQPTEKLK